MAQIRQVQTDVKNFAVQHMGNGGSIITVANDDAPALVDAICTCIDNGQLNVTNVTNVDVLRAIARPIVQHHVRLANVQYTGARNVRVHIPMTGVNAHVFANLVSTRRGTSTYHVFSGVHTEAQFEILLGGISTAVGGFAGLSAMQAFFNASNDVAVNYASKPGTRDARQAILNINGGLLRDALTTGLGPPPAIQQQIATLQADLDTANNTISLRDNAIQANNDHTANLQEDIARRNTTITTLTQQVNGLTEGRDKANGDIERLNNTVRQMNQEQRETSKELKKKDEEIEKKDQEIERLKGLLEDKDKTVEELDGQRTKSITAGQLLKKELLQANEKNGHLTTTNEQLKEVVNKLGDQLEALKLQLEENDNDEAFSDFEEGDVATNSTVDRPKRRYPKRGANSKSKRSKTSRKLRF